MQFVNEPDTDEVSWKRTENGYALHLCVESERHWCQMAYQLGYLMMHCLIDHMGEKDREITWAEELICEAATLDLLFRLMRSWKDTPFAPLDPEYDRAIWEYIRENLSDDGTSALLRCVNREQLKEINGRNLFEDRLDESHDLYRYMMEGDLQILAKAREYEADGLLLDTGKWRSRVEDSTAVSYLCRLQDRIPGCGGKPAEKAEVPAGWLENPFWREYYENAPSEKCRELIALEFRYSDDDGDLEELLREMESVEEELGLEDWKHLYRYCGNNPRKKNDPGTAGGAAGDLRPGGEQLGAG